MMSLISLVIGSIMALPDWKATFHWIIGFDYTNEL